MIPPPYPFPRKWPALFQQQLTSGHAAQWLTPYSQIQPSHAAVPFPVNAAPMPTPSPHPAPYPQPAPFVPVHPFYPHATPSWNHQHMHARAEEVDDAEEEVQEHSNGEDDYEYGYVLNDDWRQYLRDNVLSDDESWEDPSPLAPERRHHHQRHEHGRQTKPATSQSKRPRGGKKHQPTPPPPRPPSQLELAIDAAGELERHRRQQRLVTSTEDTSPSEEPSASSHMTVGSGSSSGDPSGEDNCHSSLRVVEHLEAKLHLRFEAFCDRNSPAVWPQ